MTHDEHEGDEYYMFAQDDDGKKPNAHEAEEYHDFIEDIMRSDFFKDVPVPTQSAMIISRDVLCWALGHPGNPTFGNNIRMWADAFQKYNGTIPRFDN